MFAAADRVPPVVLVLGGVVSVQFGGALAATLVPQIGAAGSVTVRLAFATAIMLAIRRPRIRGYSSWFYSGHGDDSTLGAERPHLAEWRARGW